MKEKGLSFKKRILFSISMAVGVIALLEITGALYYHLGFTKEKRELLETVIGLKNPGHRPVPRYISHPYFNYIGNPAYQFPDGTRPHNDRGFRNPQWTAKAPGNLRIVALGGSTTYGMHSRDGSDVWPALLEHKLQSRPGRAIDVVNLGMPAYTTHEILGVTAMLVPTLSPDIVLIHVGANDAFAAWYPDEGGPDNTGFRFSWQYKPLPGIMVFFMRISRLARVMGYRAAVSTKGYLPGDMIASMQYRYPAEPEAVENAAGAEGKYFRRNLSSLIALVRDMGAVPVLLTHPLSPKWEYPSKKFYQCLSDAHKRNNQIIREMAELRQVPLVDLYAHTRDIKYFVDAIHESPEGMELKAQLIAETLEDVFPGRSSGE